MAKKPPAEVSWSVYRLAAKPKYLGQVSAPDEKTALQKAFEDKELKNPFARLRCCSFVAIVFGIF